MRRVISFNTVRGAASGVVEVNAHENRFRLIVCHRCPILQRNVGIVRTGQGRDETAFLKKPLHAMRHVERQIFFHDPVLRRSGILAAVAGIDDDDGEGRGRRRGRFDAGYRPGDGRDLKPDEGDGHEQQTDPSQARSFACPCAPTPPPHKSLLIPECRSNLLFI